MADPCPSCDAPLSLGGTFCKECGYDLELQVADWEGAGAELPDEEFDEQAYQRTLAREGLAEHEAPGGVPWTVVLVVVVVAALAVAALVVR